MVQNGSNESAGQVWQEALVYALHEDLREELDRSCKSGVKINIATLYHLSLDITCSSEKYCYRYHMIDATSEPALYMKINLTWIQSFSERFRIISRAHAWKHRMSHEKELAIEVDVVANMCTLCGLIISQVVHKYDPENADETHFIPNVDNGRTLGF